MKLGRWLNASGCTLSAFSCHFSIKLSCKLDAGMVESADKWLELLQNLCRPLDELHAKFEGTQK